MRDVASRPGERIHKVFIDPRGNHVLFTVVSDAPQTYYLHVEGKEPEKVGKITRANAVLETVAWDKRPSAEAAPADNTGAILMGSRYMLRAGSRCHAPTR